MTNKFYAVLVLLGTISAIQPIQAATIRPGLPATQGDQNASIGLQLDAYILGPGDILQLRMADPTAQTFSGNLEILNDGTASLALLGSAQLSGLTLSQASEWITLLYSKILLRPELTLSIVTPRPMQVSVIGEVQTPGLYSLSPGGEGSAVPGASASIPGLPTVVSAIQKAGGITLNANLRDVLLRRRLPGQGGSMKQINLNLAELLENGNKLQNPFLFDGDTILIARAETQETDEILQLGAANLSPQDIAVNVIGEVKSPGRVQLRANSPLVDAVLNAGGPNNWRANKNNVELIRVNRNGTATRQLFSLDYSQGVSNASNPPLRQGDTIIVNRSLYGEALDVLDQVIVPLSQIGNFFLIYDNFNDNNN